jgi:hypothetical protein
MFTKLYDMAYQIEGDEVDIEQGSETDGGVSLVQLHRWHISHLAELMGIVKAPADGESQKIITSLTRRLLVLAERSDHLATHLETVDGQTASTFAQTYSRATADIADQFCAELDSDSSDVGEPQ